MGALNTSITFPNHIFLFLQQLIKLAVEQGKWSKINDMERLKESAVDASVEKNREDKDAEKASPKKKKKQSKRRGKK